jgi:predicted enzyme related to lactoylglutathione lyase
MSTYAPGSFCWIDLASSNVEGSRDFYKRLFGWDASDRAYGPGGRYWAFTAEGQSVAGLFPLSDHDRETGRPPGWSTYIASDAVAETAQRAQALGGTILAGPEIAGEGAGEFARIVDPKGAIFVLWKSGARGGAERYGDLNSVCWFELQTPDAAVSERFYTSLFGWSTKTGFNAYTEWVHQDRATGGLVPVAAASPVDPAHWLPYIRVANADATITSAQLLHATVVTPVHRIEGVGLVATLRDPQGARLSIVEFA